MLKSVKVNFSETGALDLDAKGITIFVGPNNSGKSLLLREVESLFIHYPTSTELKIVKDFEIHWPSPHQIEETVNQAHKSKARSEFDHIILTRININSGREDVQLHIPTLKSVANEKSNKNWLLSMYYRSGVIRLDGRSRFNLTNDQTCGDLDLPPQNILSHIFREDSIRSEIRSTIKDAINTNFYIDPTNLGSLRIKISDNIINTDEQSINKEARQFYKSATYIKDSSDGVQAYVGIITAVLSGEYHTILIDEPEAFLHPPLARKLGKNLASLAEKRNGTLMASTHSSDFLIGCMQGSATVKVVRLEYNGGKSRAKSIDQNSLEKLLKNPLMRSANVISGLFYDGVVVLESDNDRAFYNEIYYRLSDGKPEYPSILFVNAQNKQTIREIIEPLREFGVPAAAIPDIDIIKDGGKVWTDWLKASKIPTALHVGLGQQRSAIDSMLKATGKDMKTEGGFDLLDGKDREAADFFFDTLERYGVFPVRRGELENWLPDLGVPGKKTNWAVAMLERLGSDINDLDYVKPAEDDVWEFLDKVVAWIKDPSRAGTV